MPTNPSVEGFFSGYAERLQRVLLEANWRGVEQLAGDLMDCWTKRRQVFLCGNGGSAGNAIHLANDLLYGVAKKSGGGLRVHALAANPAVITCLANDIGYDEIYAEQLAVHGQPGDLLIAMSGSGNSPNIVKAVARAKALGIKTYSLLGFTGGKCKELTDVAIHFPVDDMQIAEDMQLVVGHMLMQWLYANRPRSLNDSPS